MVKPWRRVFRDAASKDELMMDGRSEFFHSLRCDLTEPKPKKTLKAVLCGLAKAAVAFLTRPTGAGLVF